MGNSYAANTLWEKLKHNLYIIGLIIVALISLTIIAHPVHAADGVIYYVDFENGTDTNTGVSPEEAWKHAPGDSNASNNPASVVLLPGDTVLFKGGVVYRGKIVMKYSGNEGAPITYKGDGWGDEKAIIDGSMPLSGNWKRCESPESVAGNPNWEKIYYITYTGGILPFTQFFEGETRAYIAQTPNMTDPFWDDRHAEYQVTQEGITETSIKDSSFFTQASSDYWQGAYIQIYTVPNVISIRKITSYDPANNTVFFESIPSTNIYNNEEQYYSIVNHLSALDRAGEYVVDEANQKVFYWPHSYNDQFNLEVSQLSYGIGTNNHSFVTIEGFLVRRYSDDSNAVAIWNNRYFVNEPSRGVVVKHNEITHIRTKDGRKGAVAFANVNDLLIEGNEIHHCQRNSGILLSSNDTLVRDNRIYKVGYKGIWINGVSSLHARNIQLLRNEVFECEGTHGNPVSVFYADNTLTANNYLKAKAGEVFTFSYNENMVVYNNILLASIEGDAETGTNLIRQNFPCTGYTIIANNTILYSKNGCGIGISSDFEDLRKVIIKNNITDGGPGGTLNRDMLCTHNLYTGLNWSQTERNDWRLNEGEFIVEDLNKIFIDHLGNDFKLRSDSVARDAGVDVAALIPQEIRAIFSDYDFTKDIAGNSRGAGGGWDLGAYEFIPSSSMSPSNLKAQETSGSVYLTWDAPTNPETELAGYQIYREQTQIGTSFSQCFTDDCLIPGVSYNYKVVAVDWRGNLIGESEANSVVCETNCCIYPSGVNHSANAWTGTVYVFGIDNTEWTVSASEGVAWIVASGSGSGNGKFEYTLAPNTSADRREGKVILTWGGSQTIEFTIVQYPKKMPSTLGFYDPGAKRFMLWKDFEGSADITISHFGLNPGDNWIPIVGDWNGNKTNDVGFYNPDDKVFYMIDGIATTNFSFGGNAVYIPLVGDWNGDDTDTVGLYSPETGAFLLTNSTGTESLKVMPDLIFKFGPTNSALRPIVGDWNGDGIDTVGLYDADNGIFYLKRSFASINDELVFSLGPAVGSWLPIVGDWDGDQMDTVGLYNPETGEFYLRNSNSSGEADIMVCLGTPELDWIPVSGEF